MNLIKAPQTDIEAYLHNDFNIEIYEDLTEGEVWKQTFEPLEFLNLLYEQFEMVTANKEKPLTVTKHLLKLDLKRLQFYYLLHFLKTLIYQSNRKGEFDVKDKQLNICLDFIEKEYDKLEKELFPKDKNEPPKVISKWSFSEVKKHLESLPSIKEKIKYLIEVKTDYAQNKGSQIEWLDTTFDKQCELEIKKLKAIAELEPAPVPIAAKPQFKLSKRTGAKTDLIRVLNALYELKFFVNYKEQEPLRKKDFMMQIGQFFGTGLSNYDAALSQARREQPLETNLKIFEDMKSITQNEHYTSEAKRTKNK